MKSKVFMVLIMAVPAALFGSIWDYQGLTVDLACGIQLGAFSGYNAGLSGEKISYAMDGYNSALKEMDNPVYMNGSAIAVYDAGFFGLAGAGIVLGYAGSANGSNVYYPSGEIREKRRISIDSLYAAAAVRKYFDAYYGFAPFAGMEAGMIISVNNYIEKDTYTQDGRIYTAEIDDINCVVPSLAFEAGVNYDMGIAGLFAKLGYRAASSVIKTQVRSNDYLTDGSAGKFKYDFSGIYMLAGISAKFGGIKIKNNIMEAAALRATAAAAPQAQASDEAVVQTAAVSAAPVLQNLQQAGGEKPSKTAEEARAAAEEARQAVDEMKKAAEDLKAAAEEARKAKQARDAEAIQKTEEEAKRAEEINAAAEAKMAAADAKKTMLELRKKAEEIRQSGLEDSTSYTAQAASAEQSVPGGVSAPASVNVTTAIKQARTALGYETFRDNRSDTEKKADEESTHELAEKMTRVVEEAKQKAKLARNEKQIIKTRAASGAGPESMPKKKGFIEPIVKTEQDMTPVFGDPAKKEHLPEELPAIEKSGPFEEISKQGDSEFLKEQYSSAVESYKKALKIKNDAVTNKKAGNCCYYAGNMDEAIRYYRASLKLNPDDAELKEFINALK